MNRLRVWQRLAAAILAALGPIAASTVAAAGSSDDRGDRHLRATAAALAVARHARSLSDTASVRTSAELSPDAMAKAKASIDADAAEIRRQLEVLASADHEDAAARLRGLLDEMMGSVRQLEDSRPQFAQVLRDSQRSRRDLIAATSWQLLPAALASEDELFYRMVAGHDDTERQASPASGPVSVADLLLYARLALLTAQIDQGYIALEVATRLSDSEFIGTVEENAHLVMYQLRENIEGFSDAGHGDLDPTLVPLARALVEAAYGESNLIGLMKTRLRQDEREALLASAIDTVASSLQAQVDAVLEQAVADLALIDTKRDTAAALQAAFALRRDASAAASHGSGLTTASTPVAELPRVREAVTAHVSGMRQDLDTLADLGYATVVARLSVEIDRIESIAERIQDGRPELAGALRSAARERADLRSFVDYRLEPAVVASLDNQLYYMLTGRSEFRDGAPPDADPLAHLELMRYRHLALVYSSLFRTFSGLIIAIIMTEETLIGEGEERFGTASHRLERSIDYLEARGGPELDPQLVPLARQFVGFGSGESNVFDSLRHRLPLIASERDLIEANRQVHSRLRTDLDAFVDGVLQDAFSAPDVSPGTR